MVGVTVNNQRHEVFSFALDEPEFKLEKFQLLTCVFLILNLRIDCFQQWLGEKHRMETAKFDTMEMKKMWYYNSNNWAYFSNTWLLLFMCIYIYVFNLISPIFLYTVTKQDRNCMLNNLFLFEAYQANVYFQVASSPF